jgi:hypothetical protein
LLVLAEIGWRWTFGAAALAISIYALGRLLATTELSDGMLLALASGTPFLIADTVAHIALDLWPRLLVVLAILLPALALLWTFASATGRAATLKALLAQSAISMRAMFGLSFLRAGLTLAGVLAWVAAFVIAGRIAVGKESSSPGTFLVVLMSLGFLVSALWTLLSWYLSLAPLFSARDGRDAFSSVLEAVRTVRRKGNSFSAVSGTFGFLHLIAFACGTMVALMPLALIGIFSGKIVLALMGAATLGYFAVMDFLYIARLAAYAHIVAEDGEPTAVSSQPSAISTTVSNLA